MSDIAPLAVLSRATAAVTAAAAARVVGVRDGQGRHLSGIVWGEGQIVTAEECLAGDDGITVTVPDSRSLPAELAGRDPSTDVALLRCDVGAVTAWSRGELPTVGALALVVGRGGEGPLAALALVAATGPAWTSAGGGRIDARVCLRLMLPHALEGGAAVDAEGNLIGLAVGGPRRRGLVIPCATIARSVEAVAARGHVGRGYLGLGLRPLGATPGLVVVEVVADGPGAAAGFLLGDIVTTWDGEPVGSMRQLARRLGPDAVGRSVSLGRVRAGSAGEATVTIGERPRSEE